VVDVFLASVETTVEKKILVIDDDPAFARLVGRTLTQKGYEVLSATSGNDGLRLLFDHRPDMVLLDVVMPGMDGWQTCSRIRDVSDIPIIMITGHEKTEDDVVRGLDYGADDYVIKPVGGRELVARVKALMRRAESPSSPDGGRVTYSDDFLNVDISARKVMLNGKRVRLTPVEFRLLALLMQNAGRILPHRELLEKVWGWEYINDLDYIRIYVWHLRQKIEPDPSQPKYIITEPGVGYYFHKAD
jgi:two-component system KDP operon response regulator KdpE